MQSPLETGEGEILDKTYRLVRLVAEGGMGLVYEATHARLAGRYAIKVLPPQWSKDPSAMARFDREARITSSLQHPNIVQIIDFNTADDGTEYLVMEYLEGETLAARLARLGPMPLDVVVPIVEQVASGLAAAHAHGIVHRDLKPENVLLMQVEGRDGDWAKILDFGISKLTGSNADTIGPGNESLIGTPLYMAPEQCEGRTKDVDAATDQFALAVLTYEMLTGRPPFAGDSIGDVLFRVLHADPPPMHVDRGIESVVRRGLAKSSRRRYPSVTAFAEALRAAAQARAPRLATDWSEESISHGYAVGELESLTVKTPLRRRSWRVGLAAAGVAAAAAVFVVHTANTKGMTVSEFINTVRPSPALIVPATAAVLPDRPPERPVQPKSVAEAEVVGAPAPVASAAEVAPRSAGEAAAEPDVREIPAAPAGHAAPRAARTPAVQVARAPSSSPVVASGRTPAFRGAARERLARPSAVAPVRQPAIAEQPGATLRQPSAIQPPPFKPLPADDDAVLPLSEL